MGNAELKPRQITDITRQTGFNEKQVKEWFKKFLQKAGGDANLSRMEFLQIYKSLYPHSDGEGLVTKVFDKFDANNNGKINFQEFISALGITTNGSTKERVGWVFSMYDLDDNGYLDRLELTRILRAVNKMAGSVVDEETLKKKVHKMYKNYDKDNNAQLSVHEFLNAVKMEPQLRELFAVPNLPDSDEW